MSVTYNGFTLKTVKFHTGVTKEQFFQQLSSVSSYKTSQGFRQTSTSWHHSINIKHAVVFWGHLDFMMLLCWCLCCGKWMPCALYMILYIVGVLLSGSWASIQGKWRMQTFFWVNHYSNCVMQCNTFVVLTVISVLWCDCAKMSAYERNSLLWFAVSNWSNMKWSKRIEERTAPYGIPL